MKDRFVPVRDLIPKNPPFPNGANQNKLNGTPTSLSLSLSEKKEIIGHLQQKLARRGISLEKAVNLQRRFFPTGIDEFDVGLREEFSEDPSKDPSKDPSEDPSENPSEKSSENKRAKGIPVGITTLSIEEPNIDPGRVLSILIRSIARVNEGYFLYFTLADISHHILNLASEDPELEDRIFVVNASNFNQIKDNIDYFVRNRHPIAGIAFDPINAILTTVETMGNSFDDLEGYDRSLGIEQSKFWKFANQVSTNPTNGGFPVIAVVHQRKRIKGAIMSADLPGGMVLRHLAKTRIRIERSYYDKDFGVEEQRVSLYYHGIPIAKTNLVFPIE